MVQQAANIVTFCRRLFQNRITPDDPWPNQVENRRGKKACFQEQAWSTHQATNAAEDC